MAVEVKRIVRWMESWAPPSLAEEGDKIGLLVGSMDAKVAKAAVALDVTEEVVDEAIAAGAGLIIAHHPLIYRPLAAVRTDRPDGRLLRKLLLHDIAVFAAHTNLDVAEGGVNDLLAERLGLTGTAPLKTTGRETLYKLVVYVPASHADAVRQAAFDAGAGHIGRYSHCGFSVDGTGTFLPEAGANPYLGEAGKLERAEEVRFETIVPESRRADVVRAVIAAHPYEEVAYDVFRLELSGAPYGIGRIGELPAAEPLRAFAERAKAAFGVPALRFVGDAAKPVRRVAVVGGSGRSFVKHALAAGADVYVTGDLDHHTAHDALAAGLALVDPGHHIEQVMKAAVAEKLNAHAAREGWNVEAYASAPSTEPFTFI
ncbi:Nif3-like dinuclear metal center hexameric protein [Paenibacillus sp.]|uniref:Nif3-like dinuclear metal center hexameric protein n=1 Tax=Paenibacillus sp. TaxID=58172 RepID=UPI002D57F53B|nr:Nif3-like dinuclear metal center hexameric protein [Paenibacillus sp.]HZG84673.1 Nif3-like dinuclear metal center hexameric protein [Paenibacillus sp.]